MSIAEEYHLVAESYGVTPMWLMRNVPFTSVKRMAQVIGSVQSKLAPKAKGNKFPLG